MALTKKIVQLFVPGIKNTKSIENRARVGLLEGWVSISVNTALALVKGWMALLTGSLSLMADAIHSMSDSGTSVVVILGFKMSAKPPDKEHPFGHGRIEHVAGIIVAMLLFGSALEMGRVAYDRILNPSPVMVEAWVVIVLIMTIGAKVALTVFSRNLARIIDSQTLMADAWHHASDVLSTALVIVALFGDYLGMPWLDGVMTIAVALLLAWASFTILKNSLDPLVGEYAPEQTYREIAQIAKSVEGVEGVHEIMVHLYGTTHVISLHVEVSSQMSLNQAHEISEQIEEQIDKEFFGNAVVHVDPVNREHELYAQIEAVVDDAVDNSSSDADYHDLRIVGSEESMKILLDISAPPQAETDALKCRETIAQNLKERWPKAKFVAKIDPPFVHIKK